eukprot:Gb_35735 [translate_table: standard]
MAQDEEKLEHGLDKDCLHGSNKARMQDVLWSLLYGVGDVQIKAAEEIRRLTKTSAKSRAYLAAAGVIIPLVSMLKSTNLEAKEAAVLALLNLAVGNERNKVRIVKTGAIPSLVELLQSENANLRESAAAAILTLSASAINKPVIGASGATPLLVEMLTSGSLQGKFDAVMALYNLSTCTENLLHILVAGAVPPLIRLLKDCKKSSKFSEKTTALLDSLLAFEEGRIAVVKEEGGILALVEVVEDGSPQSREHAAGALLKLCQTSTGEYKQAILKEGVIPGLLELTVQGTRKAQQQAQTLLQLLRDSSPSTQTSPSSVALGNIVYDIASHVDGVDQASETAKQMLSEMVHLSMEQSMRHLQQRALVCIPSEISQSNCLAEVPSK